MPGDLNARTIGTGVGFGDTGNGRDGTSGNDGKKRGFQNVLDCLNGTYDNGNGNLYGYQADFDDTTAGSNTLDATDNSQVGFPASQRSSRTWLNLEGLGAAGDSGGGLFADVDGSTLLIGVESGNKRIGSSGLDRYGSCTVWTPMDAEMAGDVTQWTGIQPAPEPGCFLSLGVGLLAVRRRRV
jgi:hypothetical protein